MVISVINFGISIRKKSKYHLVMTNIAMEAMAHL